MAATQIKTNSNTGVIRPRNALRLSRSRAQTRLPIVACGVVACFASAFAFHGPAQARDQADWRNAVLQPGTTASNPQPINYNRAFVTNWEKNPPRGFPTLARENIKPTKRAIEIYQTIVDRGGWPKLPKFETLEMGMNNRKVRLLQERLIMSGHLRSESYYPSFFDKTLEKAVRRFQATNGLTPTGVVDQRTRLALNVPAKVRLRQLKKNLTRLRRHVQSRSGRYVVVNIPAAQIEAIEDNKVHSRHTGVVGKLARPTPLLTSRIYELNFNPVWRLPPTVVKKDLIPKGRSMQRNKESVLMEYGIDAYDGNGRKLNPTKINWSSRQPFNLSYRQKPGPDNPLGCVKINFHNAHSVYLHDTPSDRLFGRNFRAASSGCVRVSNIKKLLVWLLEDQDDWSRARITKVKKDGKSINVRLKRPVRLHLVYLTAWATPDGIVQFRRDLYQRDKVGAIAASY